MAPILLGMKSHRNRYNSLLHEVARQIADLKKAAKGLVVVTPELEEISQSMLQGKVRVAVFSGLVNATAMTKLS